MCSICYFGLSRLPHISGLSRLEVRKKHIWFWFTIAMKKGGDGGWMSCFGQREFSFLVEDFGVRVFLREEKTKRE